MPILKLGSKLLVVMLELDPLKVGSNICPEYAVRPLTDTVTGPTVAPVGTVTVRLLGLAAKTVA